MLELEPLSTETFRPFGQVAQPGLGQVKEIRDGTVRLTRSPALLDRDAEAVDLALDFYEAMPEKGRMDILQAENHPHSAQLFVPLDLVPYLVIVWPGHPDETSPRAFVGQGAQAVIYTPGVWHHGIVALQRQTPFLSSMWRCTGGGDTEFASLAVPLSLDLSGIGT